ncbi:hypothetical protein ORS3428_22290 [Mesorhizobium sp. ORS 3428]|nr:hypothetical protein ORS3428_22290 [Mesorhizobium sp. ORS 3428]
MATNWMARPKRDGADPDFNFASEIDHSEDFRVEPLPAKKAVDIASFRARSVARITVSSAC